MEYIHHYDSPLGGITTASDGKALTGLWFDGQKYFADTLEKDPEEKALPVFDEADRWLDIYFSGHEPGFTPPIHMKTTPFRKAVWEILLTIPFGRTMTYGEIAARIAEQNADHSLSPCCRRGRQPDRLCRRDRQESEASVSGKRGHVCAFCSPEGNGAVMISYTE